MYNSFLRYETNQKSAIIRQEERMPDQTHLIFVYGTLRNGSSNHGLLRTARFVGTGKTALHYALYLGEYPYAYKNEALGPITGEVYAVDSPTLARLDELEEHPEVYAREPTEILLDSGQRMVCWLYFYPYPEGLRSATGDFFHPFHEP